MKAKITIRRGRQVLFSGVVESDKRAYVNTYRPIEVFLGDLFNIELYINAQGAYRCHIEECDDTTPAPAAADEGR